jgi:cell division protein FtsI (penicillin-binding protein 3)
MFGENGAIRIQGRRIAEAETHEKFAWITLKKMIEVSSNVVSAKLAMKLGQDKVINGLRDFGFGARTGIGFPGELSGWLPPTKSKWQPLTLATVGFGQGIMVTPLQMVRSYATFINGGYLVEPRFLKNPASTEEAPAPKRVMTPEAALSVVDALKSVVSGDGTGKKAALEGYVVAGKTGTAQTVDPKTKRYSTSRYISSFVGFPVGVEPKIVILTLLDDPRGIYYASETAAPLFHDVLNAVVTRFGIPMNMPVTETPPKPLAVKSLPKKPTTESLVLTQSHPTSPKLELQGSDPSGKLVFKMPELTGMTIREALAALQGYDFHLDVSGSGWLHSQVPAAGTKVSEADRIRLRFEPESD